MEYLLIIIGFVATVTATLAKTFEKKKSQKPKITLFGYLAISLGALSLVFSILLKRKANISSQEKEKIISQIRADSQAANDTIQVLRGKIIEMRKEIARSRFDILQVVERTEEHVQRMDQVTLASFYRIQPGESITLDGTYYSGTRLDFSLLGCSDLILEYGKVRQEIPVTSSQLIPVIGPSGKAFKCKIVNLSDRVLRFPPFIGPVKVKL